MIKIGGFGSSVASADSSKLCYLEADPDELYCFVCRRHSTDNKIADLLLLVNAVGIRYSAPLADIRNRLWRLLMNWELQLSFEFEVYFWSPSRQSM